MLRGAKAEAQPFPRKLERLVDGPSEAHVVLRIDKHRQSAEIQFKSRSIVLSGTEETGDLYVSIGEVVAVKTILRRLPLLASQ